MFSIHPLTAFQDNYIWVLQQDQDPRCWVVDPGDAAPVLAYLEATQRQLEGILITHHHPDHIGGVADLSTRFSCQVVGSAADQSRLPPLTHAVQCGDHLPLLDGQIEVLSVPGHTLHHLAFSYADQQGQQHVFCGDTLFAAGCGRLFEGTAQQMYQSLQTLAAFPDGTLYYPAHEYTLANINFALKVEPSSLALQARLKASMALRAAERPTLPTSREQEAATNPYWRLDQPEIQSSIRQFAAQQGDEMPETAAAWLHFLRLWKNAS
ncbi:hydroxyacylglutathione hydrolase [Marinospirillum sp.]|uniref:hydroxyacylglutathione hydrolase n=1 Tax=Marinospirillum sp. TaxID=2183934 RepID=UPI003A86E37F